MSIVTSLVLSHPHITSHQLAFGEAENVTFHRNATIDRAVPPSHPLLVNRADPITEAERKRLPGRWDRLWHSATVWRRKNEGAVQKEALPAENDAPAQPVAQTLRRRRDSLTGVTGGTLVVTLKRFTALLLGAGFLAGSGSAAVMPPRRLPLGSG